MLGLTLPDSRILTGIASIGLTLTNIAVILPYLRQPILDGTRAHECAFTDEQSTQARINSSDRSNAMQQTDFDVESPLLACSAIVKPGRSAATEPLKCSSIDPEAMLQPTLLLPVKKIDDDQIPPQIYRSPDADFNEKRLSSGHLLAREGLGPFQIPLPAPDAVEIAFFDITDANLSNCDLGEDCPAAPREQRATPKEHTAMKINGSITGEGTRQCDQIVVADHPSTPAYVERSGDLTDMAMLVTNENVVPTPTKVIVGGHYDSVMESAVSRFPNGLAAHGGTVQTGRSLDGAEIKRRPESLEFIPQSVIRRYRSTPTTSAGQCFGHRVSGSGPDHLVTPMSSHILVHNPVILLEGTRPRASHAIPEGGGRVSFLTEVHPKRPPMAGQTFVIDTAPAQDSFQKGSTSLPEPPTVHEPTPLRKYPNRRRLGVLARAALRNRRSTARRCTNGAIDGSSSSDSDSEWDSGSQYSTGSSADESILPHMLGADLIAAIDANSESELNLAGPGRIIPTPLNMHEDFLVSEDSAADVSMAMHVSSNDDASDSEVRAPATFRPLTYEDIQRWASGVVQKCVKQVCRGRAPAEPLSPSQTSDICAERPSGSGTSQCPLSGLHCKLGSAALAEVPVPRTREPPVSLPPTSILTGRKPLSVRNLRDIPEFVPRQRHVSVITRTVEGPPRFSMRPNIDVTREAATEVIARMENRAGFNIWR